MTETTETKGKHGGKRTPGKKSATKRAVRNKPQPEEMTISGNECRIPYKSLRIEGKHIVFTI